MVREFVWFKEGEKISRDDVKFYFLQEIAINLEKLNENLARTERFDSFAEEKVKIYQYSNELWLKRDDIEMVFDGNESMVFSRFHKVIGYYFGDEYLKKAIQLVPFLKLEPSGVGFRVYFVKEEVS